MALGPRARVLLLAALVFAALAALVWYLSYAYWPRPVTPLPPARPETVGPATPTPTTTPRASPPANAPPPEASPTSTPTPQPQNSLQPQPRGAGGDATLASMHLLLPVQGVRPEELRDTFTDSRSEGRVHDAIDIMAPRDAPVLAAADGRVVKLFRSVKGGVTLYQLAAADERVVLYYAHLERYADGLAEGHFARRGETIAYVGDTGNVSPGATHLHFQIYRVTDPKHFWTGDDVNPYPLLRYAQ
jgi:murein DD-endopeptidase MepM/ murein hydrolase activator NlpD